MIYPSQTHFTVIWHWAIVHFSEVIIFNCRQTDSFSVKIKVVSEETSQEKEWTSLAEPSFLPTQT